MVSVNTLCKKILNVKYAVVEDCNIFDDADGVKHMRIKARPNRWHENDCPFCHKPCPVYDRHSNSPRTWRGLDWGGILVEVEYRTHRIECPEHGVYVADVPWAYPGSGFTREFDLTVAWLATYLPRSTVSGYMRIDWQTVGSCVNRALHDLEPERSRRLNGLVNIGIDETSYKKGHKYITVIVNHDTNTVVWASEGHGKTVLEKFYRQLTEEQLSTIEVVTGDGAKWITECVNEFTPGCARCVDSFHVVEWAMDALDEVRRIHGTMPMMNAGGLERKTPAAPDALKRAMPRLPLKKQRPQKRTGSKAQPIRLARRRNTLRKSSSTGLT